MRKIPKEIHVRFTQDELQHRFMITHDGHEILQRGDGPKARFSRDGKRITKAQFDRILKRTLGIGGMKCGRQ